MSTQTSVQTAGAISTADASYGAASQPGRGLVLCACGYRSRRREEPARRLVGLVHERSGTRPNTLLPRPTT